MLHHPVNTTADREGKGVDIQRRDSKSFRGSPSDDLRLRSDSISLTRSRNKSGSKATMTLLTISYLIICFVNLKFNCVVNVMCVMSCHACMH